MVEVPGDRTAGAQLALAEQHADLGDGAVDVVGQALDDQRHLMRREAFVADGGVLHRVAIQACAFADRPFECLAGHRGLFGLFYRQTQTRVGVRVGAGFGSDLNFLGQLAHDLAFGIGCGFSVLGFPLCAHVDSLRFSGPVQEATGQSGSSLYGPRQKISRLHRQPALRLDQYQPLSALPAAAAYLARRTSSRRGRMPRSSARSLRRIASRTSSEPR